MPFLQLRAPAVPPSLRGPVLVDGQHRPRFWATYHQVHSGAHWADSTARASLEHIDGFYLFVSERLGRDCLDELIAELDSARLLTCVEAFFGQLRNEQARSGVPKRTAWRDVTAFLSTCVEAIGMAGRVHRSADKELLTRLDQLKRSLQVGRKKKRQRIRALPGVVVEDLWELMLPESRRNPFRNSVSLRHRNFIILLLLLYQGLRRSEATILSVDSAHADHLGAREYDWIDIRYNPYEEFDSRALPPSLKTEWATRQIPLARPLALAIENYVQNHRGRQPHSYLLASQWRRGLAVNSVNSIFDRVSTRLSKAAGRALWTRHREARISPHDLRHTCAVVRLKQFTTAGVPLEEAVGKHRNFFGWAPESSMPGLYARAYFDERLVEIWQKDFDAHISFIRSLPRG